MYSVSLSQLKKKSSFSMSFFFQPVCSAELTAAVLCVVSDESMVISSSFDHKICAMDARYRLQKMIELEFHDSAVFDLAQEVSWLKHI